MRYLVDSHLLIWVLEASKRLSRRARKVLSDPSCEYYVSAASVWEIVIKASLKKLELGRDLQELEPGIEAAGFRFLPIQPRHAVAVGALAFHHNDPFDRLLVAQCKVEHLTLLTSDRALAKYENVVVV